MPLFHNLEACIERGDTLNLSRRRLSGFPPFTPADIPELINILISNPCINSLVLCEDNIGDDIACILASNLIRVPTLTSLNLSSNIITNKGAMTLLSTTTLKHLNLSGNKINHEGIKPLRVNTTLQSLIIADNYIGDNGVRVFLENRTLTNLYLAGNEISQQLMLDVDQHIISNSKRVAPIMAYQMWISIRFLTPDQQQAVLAKLATLINGR